MVSFVTRYSLVERNPTKTLENVRDWDRADDTLPASLVAKHGAKMRICVSLGTGRIDVLELTRRWLLLSLMAA